MLFIFHYRHQDGVLVGASRCLQALSHLHGSRLFLVQANGI